MSDANMPWLRWRLAKAIGEQSAGAPPEELVSAIEAMVRGIVSASVSQPELCRCGCNDLPRATSTVAEVQK